MSVEILKCNSKIFDTSPIYSVGSKSPLLESGLVEYGRSDAVLVFQLRPLENGSLYFLHFGVSTEPKNHSVRKQTVIWRNRVQLFL